MTTTRSGLSSGPASGTRAKPGGNGRLADELAIPLLPKVGYQWMPQDATVKLVTPGQNQKHSLAGALEPQTRRSVFCASTRKPNALFRAVLDRRHWLYPQAKFDTVCVVVDHYGMH